VPGNRTIAEEHDRLVPLSNITVEEKRSSIENGGEKDQNDRSEDMELGERKDVKKLEDTVKEQENVTKGEVKEYTGTKNMDMDEAKGQSEQTRQTEEKKDRNDNSGMPSSFRASNKPEDKPSDVFQQDSTVIQNLPPPIHAEEERGSETPKFEAKDHMSMSAVGERIKEALAESTAALSPDDSNEMNDSGMFPKRVENER